MRVLEQVDDRRRAPEPVSAVPSPRGGFWARHEPLVKFVAVLALLLGLVYLTWRIGWTSAGISPILFVPLLAAEIFGWCSIACYAFLAWSVPETVRPAPLRGVSVDVLVCTYDEPVAVVEATLVGCRAITAPHTTYLLDDGRRPEMADLAARLGARYVTRPDNDHAKAGNINHALGVVDGELILVLDADHVPMPDILDAMSGYFADPEVALVQSPHDFSNRDSFQHTKLQRHEQTLFYSVIAPGKDRHNAMFWCGSATLLRRVALLEVGGVLYDTIAEDFHTTIAMHARGWRTRYHDEVLVQGLAPHDLAAFLLQRARWARGNLGVFRTRENPLTCPGLRPKQRASYFASLLNYFGGLQRLALLTVLIVTLASGQLPMRATMVGLVAFWLPWSVVAFVATLALGRGALGPLDSTRYGLLTMGIYLRGIGALFARSVGGFKVTPKEGIDEGGVAVLRAEGLLTTVGIALAAAWMLRLLEIAGVLALPPLPAFATVVVVALGAWELFCVGKTLIPVVRRRQLRTHFRTPVLMRGRIAGTAARVDVTDLSVQGIGFRAVGAFPVGGGLSLLTRVPDAHGDLHELALPLEVRSSHLDDDGVTTVVGCRIGWLDDASRWALVEFCDVVLPRRRLDSRDELPVPVARVHPISA
ncbi:MAG: glycosyltransferase [Acidimicrobiia bacterium]|jgi:cellulose synthase (UDP-forming)